MTRKIIRAIFGLSLLCIVSLAGMEEDPVQLVKKTIGKLNAMESILGSLNLEDLENDLLSNQIKGELEKIIADKRELKDVLKKIENKWFKEN